MNYTKSEREPNPNYVPPATESGYAKTIKERLNHRPKIDPLFKLFNYACDKMYRVIYIPEGYSERVVKGLLVNCHGPLMVLLGEKGLYYIKHKDIQLMEPIPMPQNLCDNYRSVIETYLKEEAEFKRGKLNDEEN